MANTDGRKTSSSNRKRTPQREAHKNGNRSVPEREHMEKTPEEKALFQEIYLIILCIGCIFLFLCNFHIIGSFGDFISNLEFGLFGFTAYILPPLVFLFVVFWMANKGKRSAGRKMTAMVLLTVMFAILCELITPQATSLDSYSMSSIYSLCKENRNGGGVLFGSLAYFLKHYLEVVGTILVVFLISVISVIVLTEKSLIRYLKNGSMQVKERGMEDYKRRKERHRLREEEESLETQEEEETGEEVDSTLTAKEEATTAVLRRDKKVSGVILDTSLKKQDTIPRREDVHEIEFHPIHQTRSAEVKEQEVVISDARDREPEAQIRRPQAEPIKLNPEFEPQIRIHREEPRKGIEQENQIQETGDKRKHAEPSVPTEAVIKPDSKVVKPAKKYMFPPLSCLQKGKGSVKDSSSELKETALRLQQTLNTFGVKVTITDISQGPSVTRYELQPEQGVKVSKIVGLTDDIKLNLAATDIRIEAPIPGKAAIGIEVPNKENQMVALRDLLENREFQEFDSNLAFAVGKDIAGKTIVTDIAKMPHMLIAGSTGSGKSVCINTLIMSILYKAHPDDVKLIMVDPKVVELSVYNGIPHLLIPVVTDPKKASAALHWAVTEMEERYRKFADFNVRDLKGYNKKVLELASKGEEPVPKKLPQIVIIVDELADLMMVCPGEVEESICRLAQLARACGIHVIIATQRPSVDVITGLIKANMPSRVAFAVASGVDSRTILDQVGAEKLLGKGDMLFYPQGYSKPARVQGAFVSDKEVYDVVDFLKNQEYGNVYANDVEEKLNNMESSTGNSSGGGSSENDLDEYFAEAGRFIIDKDKASIGSLQRLLKIGFNRAARIMDQLCEYGVVGEEEGTKPRKVLMTLEEFENLLETM